MISEQARTYLDALYNGSYKNTLVSVHVGKAIEKLEKLDLGDLKKYEKTDIKEKFTKVKTIIQNSKITMGKDIKLFIPDDFNNPEHIIKTLKQGMELFESIRKNGIKPLSPIIIIPYGSSIRATAIKGSDIELSMYIPAGSNVYEQIRNKILRDLGSKLGGKIKELEPIPGFQKYEITTEIEIETCNNEHTWYVAKQQLELIDKMDKNGPQTFQMVKQLKIIKNTASLGLGEKINVRVFFLKKYAQGIKPYSK